MQSTVKLLTVQFYHIHTEYITTTNFQNNKQNKIAQTTNKLLEFWTFQKKLQYLKMKH